MGHCREYAPPVYFNGLGEANVRSQAVSKIQSLYIKAV